MKTSSLTVGLTTTAIALASIVIIGLLWLAGAGTGTSLSLSYAAGLSMIFLPCTLPLVFVIVPMSMGETPQKGLLMALLFGIGLTITITLYGIAIAVAGAYVGLDNATRIMFIVAGSAALLFGLSELKLFTIPLPSSAAPQWVYRQKDYIKAFFLGFFLGNAGVGCPNPAFYVLLTYIATTGDLTTGASLGFVHGLGRATPLILFAILGILGVSSVKWVQGHAENVRQWTAWALVVVGAFILTIGLFGMHWWEDSFFHLSWNQFMLDIAPALAEETDHPVRQGILIAPVWSGWISFMVLTYLPLLWYHLRSGLSVRVWSVALIIYALLFTMLATETLEVDHGHGMILDHMEEQHREGDEHSPDSHL